MGNFKEIKGDLIESFKKGKFDVIAHGCNCFATFGAGIALTIGKEFPEAKKADLDLDKTLPIGNIRLGKFSKAEVNVSGDVGLIYNLYTQLNPGKDFRLKALKKSLLLMKDDIEMNFGVKEAQNLRIGFPLIGCGIAGGNWDIVRDEIKKIFINYKYVTAIHFDKKVIGVNYWPNTVAKKRVKSNVLPRKLESLSLEKLKSMSKQK